MQDMFFIARLAQRATHKQLLPKLAHTRPGLIVRGEAARE
jgi:hypothetical protein